MAFRTISCAALILVMAGCQSILGIDDPTRGEPAQNDAGDDVPDADNNTPGVSASLLTAGPTVPLDGQTFFEIEIARVGGFAGDVTISIAGAPSGVAAQAVVIPAGETVGELVIGAVAPQVIGNLVTFDIVAEAPAIADDVVAVTDAPITGSPGTADIDFGNNGIFAISFGSDDGGRFNDVAIGPDGTLTAIGFGDGGLGGNAHAAIRLLPTGVVDPTWNGGALRRDSFVNGTTSESARAVAGGHQGDGKFISIGTHDSNAFTPDLGLMRYGTNGVVGDITFGNHDNGKSLHDLSLGGDEEITDGTVLSDGRILAVGRAAGVAVIARSTLTGSLDQTFGTGGIRTEAVGSSSVYHAVAVDSQGRFVVTGSATTGPVPGLMVARYNPNGTLDTAFGAAGTIAEPQTTNSASGRAIAVRPDGRILVAVLTFNGGTSFDIELRQFLDDGSPDPAFGTNGRVINDFGGNDQLIDMVLQPDGRAIVLMDSGDGKLARYRRDGSLDTTFDTDGVITVFLGDAPSPQGLELSQNSRVVVCGGNLGGVPGPGTFGIVTQLWF